MRVEMVLDAGGRFAINLLVATGYHVSSGAIGTGL